MAKEPRKHHYIPQMLLRGFVNEKGRLWSFRAGIEEPFETSQSNLFAKRDLNTVTYRDGSTNVELEKWYSQLEGIGAPFFKTLSDATRSGKRLSLDEDAWGFWHQFMFHQSKRVPTALDGAAEIAGIDAQLRNAIDKALAEKPDALKGEDERHALIRLKQTARVKAQSLPQSAELSAAFDNLGMIIFRILHSRKSFVVGDGPAGMARIGEQETFFMPIAHDLAIGYYEVRRKVEVLAVNTETIRAMNESTASRSCQIAGRSRELVASLGKFVTQAPPAGNFGQAPRLRVER